ncbi:hypothetical protein A4R44_03921 [Amycolatopsis sp. M39]|nr:hypothetical protein A4R44_03921 [Amycolatopsis sp. M39]
MVVVVDNSAEPVPPRYREAGEGGWIPGVQFSSTVDDHPDFSPR